MNASKIIIDGDIVAYRASFASISFDEHYLEQKIDELISYILEECSFYCSTGDYVIYLTGKGNFRKEIAKTAEYKGNRKSVEKPIFLEQARDYLQKKYNAIISSGEEADDLIAMEATRIGSEVIVASVDKDMLQLPALHFNFNRKDDKWTLVKEFEGLKFFYTQIITGDSADNIKGIFRVGPVKAKAMLEDCDDEASLWEAVVKAYEGNTERVIENGRLLWLRRYEGQIWEPPVVQKQKVG